MGGGAAGWLTAAILAATSQRPLQVTVVESPQVKILGVGEGTWPTMRDTLRKIGIAEDEFLLACDASFKQGTCFREWSKQHTYYHPFDLPGGFFETDLASWWHQQQPNAAFAELFSAQPALCQAHKAPRQLHTPPYAAVANYGYHLDAYKFAELLKQHCLNKLGVHYVQGHISQVRQTPSGAISSLTTDTGRTLSADFFVDCSGFAARLIGQVYNESLVPVDNQLCNDSALAVQASYADPQTPIASTTVSTAHANGWVWDIGLPHRKGVGCVYSSAFCSDETARQTLLDYLATDTAAAPVDEDSIRKISFTPGYRAAPWQHNCIAIGTAAGFVEPLEASALVMVELAATHLARQLPTQPDTMAAAARQFNRTFVARWQRILDFLKLHYVLSDRRDSAYWQYMHDRSHASEQLQDWLAQWQHRGINHQDFLYQDEIFPQASYLYILYGMQAGRQPLNRVSAPINSVLQQTARRTQQQLRGLPTNRDYINALKQHRHQHAG